MIDTTNKFMVGVLGERIVIPRLGTMTKAEALNLAAYLVVLADNDEDAPTFDELVEAIQNT